ncbi:unnamed protein product [Bursaphelenchus xylophilus]|uniref:(pine wood nematode) hypothetical protein n=1 Tax=Bursaphelenchus xylophilus TaxID=6326 RepID=A0A1I7RWS2_BURXY|nr:unnamed protein product [Bursaphelenchus xylophilus]CAG9128628.1 unnamed protein product [Bursaphelenchus xylophilus]
MRLIVLGINVFWLAVFLFGYYMNPRHGLLKTGLMLTAVCCYMFWLIIFLHQKNPLIGPQIAAKDLWWMDQQWGSIHRPVKREAVDCGETCSRY